MAEWAKHRKEELVKLLGLNGARMPHQKTYRRMLAYKVYEQEVAQLVGTYNQRGEHGDVYALNGKARRGMRKKDEEEQAYGLNVYDVAQAKVLSHVEVGRKENEIIKAPQALNLAEITPITFNCNSHRTCSMAGSRDVHKVSRGEAPHSVVRVGEAVFGEFVKLL